MSGLRLDRTAARIDVAAVRARTGTAFEVRSVLVLHFFAAVRHADGMVGHLVEMVDASAVGHFPVPAVRTALGYEVDLPAGTTRQRDLARDEPRTLAHVLRITARKRGIDVTIAALFVVQSIHQEADLCQFAHLGIPLPCHNLIAPFLFGLTETYKLSLTA